MKFNIRQRQDFNSVMNRHGSKGLQFFFIVLFRLFYIDSRENVYATEAIFFLKVLLYKKLISHLPFSISSLIWRDACNDKRNLFNQTFIFTRRFILS